MKTRGNTLVPRNPYAMAVAKRKAGAHEKTEKARRRNAKQVLWRELALLEKG